MTLLSTIGWWVREFVIWTVEVACISAGLAGFFVWAVGLVG